jgi:uncharacterized membrane protein
MEVILTLAVAVLFWAVFTARARLASLEERARVLRVELRSLQLAAEQELSSQRTALGALRAELAALRAVGVAAPQVQPEPAVRVSTPSPEPAAPVEPALPAAEPTAEQTVVPPVEQTAVHDPLPAAPSAAARVAAGIPASSAEPDPSWARPEDRALGQLRSLLLGGNTVVRLGIVVLLVGVALLLRWAAEHDLFPIELRMASAGTLALALIAVGFRQRVARPGFGFALQGGGIAALYLVVFFSMRSYHLLPPELGFVLLAAIALSSGVLAVVQNALSLLVIGEIGGFLAPILASTGGGNHVVLFSYYLLLNGLIAGVAYYKPWRTPNLLGFAFTFGVATSWGALRYQPEHFASTEPFLIAFFLIYLAIPILHGVRHPAARRGFLEGGLLFGTPLATLGLQWALVHEMRYGMAFSTLALAAIYLGLGAVMLRRAPAQLRSLAETFVPIGVGFVTMAVPYGFDNHNLTGATWALEGAGLYYLGVRQSRWLSRLAGALLQLAAGAAVVGGMSRDASALPFLNTHFLAALLLALGSLFVARHAFHKRAQLTEGEWHALQALIAWGLAFVIGAGFDEIDRVLGPQHAPGAHAAWLALLALVLEGVAGRSSWTPARYPGLLLWAVMTWLLVYFHAEGWPPYAHGGAYGFALLLLGMFVVLKRFVDTTPELPALRAAHPLALWLCVGLASSLVMQLVTRSAALPHELGSAAVTALIALVVMSLPALAARPGWPLGAQPTHYAVYGGLGLVGALLLRALIALTHPAYVAPLPYLPVLNPIDVAQLLAMFSILWWMRAAARHDAARWLPELRVGLLSVLSACAFAWWNAMLARSVHHYVGIAFRPDALWRSITLQVAFSLSWTLLALTIMVVATNRRARTPWIVGAGLLGVVVVKLFLLDLSALSTPAKIVSFLGVGMLLLLIGYFSPVPPAHATVGQPEGKPAA